MARRETKHQSPPWAPHPAPPPPPPAPPLIYPTGSHWMNSDHGHVHVDFDGGRIRVEAMGQLDLLANLVRLTMDVITKAKTPKDP